MLDENVIPMPLFIVQDGQRKRVVWCWRPYIHYYAAGHQCRSDQGANETAQRYVMLCYDMICYSASNARKFHFNLLGCDMISDRSRPKAVKVGVAALHLLCEHNSTRICRRRRRHHLHPSNSATTMAMAGSSGIES